MTVYRATAWRDVVDDTFFPPDSRAAVPQGAKAVAEVRRHLRARGMVPLGRCVREDGGEAELWGDFWPSYDRNGKVVAIWEDAETTSPA